jgi:hypothetical protein
MNHYIFGLRGALPLGAYCGKGERRKGWMFLGFPQCYNSPILRTIMVKNKFNDDFESQWTFSKMSQKM